jgi:hypothetical protein
MICGYVFGGNIIEQGRCADGHTPGFTVLEYNHPGIEPEAYEFDTLYQQPSYRQECLPFLQVCRTVYSIARWYPFTTNVWTPDACRELLRGSVYVDGRRKRSRVLRGRGRFIYDMILYMRISSMAI